MNIASSSPAASRTARFAWLLIAGLMAGPLVVPPAAQSEFDTWTGYDVGHYPQAYYVQAADVADVDGDGDVDIATVMGLNAGSLTITRNRGDGSFLPAAVTPLAKLSEGVVLADFDNDGDVDVVVSQGGNSGAGNTLLYFRNTGDGTLTAPSTLNTVMPGPAGLLAADFDGNGWMDVAAAIYGYIGTGDHVAVFLNNGAGAFLAPNLVLIPTAPSSVTGPYRLAAGDLTGDGKPEIVAACDSDRVVVLLNQGTGAFSPGPMKDAFLDLPQNFGVYSDVGLADADHDGDLDVFYACSNSGLWGGSSQGGVILLANDGAGALGTPVKLELPANTSAPISLEAADITGDGWVDLFMANGSSEGSLFMQGDGRGAFLPGVAQIPSGEYPKDVRVADATGDGQLDALVVSRHSLDVKVHAWGDGPGGGFHEPQPFAIEPLSHDMDAADIDGDGDLDVAASWEYAGSGGISVLRGQGDGSFATYVHYWGPRAAHDVKFRDLNGDGAVDLLWATGATGPPYDFHYRLNTGAGIFGTAVTVPVHTCGNGGIDAFDMDHDGDLDVFLTDYLGCAGGGDSSFVWVSRNKGNATFDPAFPLTFTLSPSWVNHGDFDGDGHLDMIVSQTNQLGVRLGRGDGTFEAPLYSATVWGPTDVHVGDLDGDGILDVATCNMAGDPQQAAAVHIGRGNGTFELPVSYPISNSPEYGNAIAMQGADVDQDGDTDLLVANYGSSDASFLRNAGDGTFAPQVRFGVGEQPHDMVYGDFDGDGVGDLASVVRKPPYALDRGVNVVRGTGAAGPAWGTVGAGLPGSLGVPLINGLGTLEQGTEATVLVAKARPLAATALVAGLSATELPFKGGVLVPAPDLVYWLTTSLTGKLQFSFGVPSAIAGLELWLQGWVADPMAAAGWAATAGLQASFP